MKSELIFDDLVGKTFKLNARGPYEYDCYGIYLEVNDRLGILIPDIEDLVLHTAKVINENVNRYVSNWRKIQFEDKICGDAIVFKTEGDLVGHIGVVVSKYTFLQITETKPSHLVSFGHPWFRSKIKGFFRYAK